MYVQAPPLLQGTYAYLGTSPAMVFLTIIALVAIGWLIFTSILFYHWRKYAHASAMAATLFAVHLVVSLVLFLLALSSIL